MYKYIVRNYNSYFENNFRRDLYDKYIKLISKYTNNNCVKILDLGCGDGLFTSILNNKNYHVTGLDISPDMIKKCRENYPECNFINSNILDYHTKDKYDAIVATLDVLNHILNNKAIKRFFAKCKELLNDDGIIIFDIISHRKYKHQLTNRKYVYSSQNNLCVWETKKLSNGLFKYTLNNYVKNNLGVYSNNVDIIFEKYLSINTIKKILNLHFKPINRYFVEKGNRIIFVCKNKAGNNRLYFLPFRIKFLIVIK